VIRIKAKTLPQSQLGGFPHRFGLEIRRDRPLLADFSPVGIDARQIYSVISIAGAQRTRVFGI
jgi:hypothetical protein